jgi:hypothetical protein
MAWLSAASAAGTIIERDTQNIERYQAIPGKTIEYTRTHSFIVTRYVGLTKAAADSQLTTSAAKANCTDAHLEYQGAGQYHVVETIETWGTWT